MPSKFTSILAFALTVLISCSKKNDPKPPQIDVSSQWTIDALGNIISSPGDGQWHAQTFTAQELNLFSSLDTANLGGTSTPGSVVEGPSRYNSSYPNPFATLYYLSLQFTNSFSGQIVLKYVIVDSTMTSQVKGAFKLNVSNSSINIAFSPTIPVGRFRFYYTLSSQSNPHFYKTWGNIQKVP